MSLKDQVKGNSFKSKLKFLLKDSAFYGITTAISKLFPIVTIPIYTKFFSKSEYATIDNITLLGFIFLTFIILGQDSSVARYFYDAETKEEKQQVATQAFITELLNALLVVIVLFFARNLILKFYLKDVTDVNAFNWLIAMLPFMAFVHFWQSLLIWTFSRKYFLIMVSGVVSSNITLILLGIFVFKWGVSGIFIAQFITYFFFSFVGFAFCTKYLTLKIKFDLVKTLVAFGIPYMVLGITEYLFPVIDRYFIAQSYPLSLLAIYIFAFRLGFLLQLPISSFQIAWGPFAYASYKEPDANATYTRILRYYSLALVIAGTAFIFFAEPIILLFADAKYISSLVYLAPFVFAMIFDSFSWITGIGIDLSKKSIYSTISYILSLAVTAPAVWLGIKLWGMYGAALGILLGKTSLTIFKTIFAYRLYDLRYDLRFVFLISFTAITITGIHHYFYFNHPAYKYLWSIIGFGTLLVIAWQFSLSRHERQQFISIIKNLKKFKPKSS